MRHNLSKFFPIQWRHDERDGVSNHRLHDCLLNRLLRRRSKKTSKPYVTALCARNSPVTGEFPAQTASDAENVSISWRHHAEHMVLWLVFNFAGRKFQTLELKYPKDFTPNWIVCWIQVITAWTDSRGHNYSISQEICTRFLLCCALLWLYIDWFFHIHQAYFTGTVAI